LSFLGAITDGAVVVSDEFKEDCVPEASNAVSLVVSDAGVPAADSRLAYADVDSLVGDSRCSP